MTIMSGLLQRLFINVFLIALLGKLCKSRINIAILGVIKDGMAPQKNPNQTSQTLG